MYRLKKILLFAIVFIYISTAAFSFDEMNRRIGIIYLKNAAANFLNEDYESTVAFLKKAGEFYPSSSDLDYINGLIKLERDNDIITAYSLFNRAVKTDNWLLLEKKDCIKDLALIMFRNKKYQEVIELVESTSFPGYGDNDLMYLYVLSLKYNDEYQKYKQTVLKSINYYNSDYRFAELYLDINIPYRDAVLMDKYKYSKSEGGLQVFLKAVMSLEESYEKLMLLEEYFSRGGNDISAYIEYYRLRGNISREELMMLLERGLFENRENALRLRSIITEIDLIETIDSAIAEYTGNIYYDLNNDKYFEELHLYENGKPAGISIDQNQDALIEVMIIFQEGLPYEVVLADEKLVRIIYSNYPFIEEISISEGNKNTVYTVIEEKLNLEIFQVRGTDQKIVVMKNAADEFIKDIDNISENSIQISVYSGGVNKDNLGYLVQQLERRSENYEILKIYNRILGNFIYHQANNTRLAGFGDINFNNLIDIKESYDDGELVSIEADENENGIYDYKVSFEGALLVSWWDFNEDGVYDCRQYEENDVIVNEYSSKLDGVFDIVERN